MKLKDKSRNIKKLLEYKSNSYKRKYFILSSLFSSDVLNSERLSEEFNCYINSLNYSNGMHPDESDLINFYQECLQYSNTSRKLIESKVRFIKKYNDLRNPKNKKDINSLINESLDSINFSNKHINKKLSSLLKESIKYKKSILVESEFASNFIDANEKDEAPSDQDLQDIELSDLESDAQSKENFEDENKNSSFKDKIINIFGPITGGLDPAKMNKQKMARIWDFGSQEMYKPGQKGPVRDPFTEYELFIGKKLDTFTRFEDSGLSTLAQRKVWIATTIDFCLKMQKQAGYLLGISSEDKARLSKGLDSAAKSDIKKAMQGQSGQRGFGKTLTDQEIRNIYNSLHEYLIKGQYDPENSTITEAGLFKILGRASAGRSDRISDFKETLEFMYPLTDTRAEFDKVSRMSDEELQKLRQQNIEFDKRLEDDDNVYGDEIDPETGEPLYADEDQIQKINRQKSEEKRVIKKQEIIQNMSKSNYFNMTSNEAVQYLKELDEDLKRLGALYDKTIDKTNPEVFSEIQTDNQGNILPDISAIPDVIYAEGLSDEEQKEMEVLIEKLAAVDIVKMINDSEREQIYQELVEKSVSVDEFIAYNKRFGLDNADKPMSWEDIKRASAGEFTGSAGARQYGVKAWIKSVFFNFSPSEKAEIYSFLAEKWYDRLKVLDLIDDQAFTIKTDKVNPNDPSKDKAIPRKVLDAAEAAGKYKRSNKLIDISNMLELVSKYTSPRYVKRYFDEKRDDNLPQSVKEKLYQIQTFAESEKEYDALVKRLETEDPDTMAFAIMESMFNDKSGFRYYATGLKKEYYNTVIWPQTELSLAQAVKAYFKRYHPSAGIARSLAANEGADMVKANEGKDLFNKLIYVAMERTGIKTSGKGVPNIGDSVEERKDYLRGKLDSRGDFEKAVAAYNTKYQQGKSPLKGKNGGVFGADDVEDIISDMFSSNGIIGKASADLKRLSSTSVGEFIAWVDAYPEAKLDQAVVLGMGLSDFDRREDADAMLTLPIEKIGKDTVKALKDYKKKYGKSQLLSSDFVEFLDDYLGMEPIDLKSKGSANPGGKNFQ